MEQPIPEGDVLVHAGDLTFRGTLGELERELEFINELPHKYKIVVGGNHDFYFDERFADGLVFRSWKIKRPKPLKEVLDQYEIIYLQDSEIVIDGIKFYGSPWQPWFHDWAFNFPANVQYVGRHLPPIVQHVPEAAKEKWAEIPEDTNVLITHGPPLGILDKAFSDAGDRRTGCPELRKRIPDLPNLKAHIFGHIHEQAGHEIASLADGGPLVHFVNAAICNRDYDPCNPPIVIDV